MARKLIIAGIALATVLGFAATSGMAFAQVATTPPTASDISTAKSAKVGTILVAAGNTVYTLKAGKTRCDAKCLKAFPPVLLPKGVTNATAGPGVDASKLGTVTTADGASQITYSGKALYWSQKDKAPGQVHGDLKDKWGKWSTVVTKKPAKPKGPPNPGTGGSSF